MKYSSFIKNIYYISFIERFYNGLDNLQLGNVNIKVDNINYHNLEAKDDIFYACLDFDVNVFYNRILSNDINDPLIKISFSKIIHKGKWDNNDYLQDVNNIKSCLFNDDDLYINGKNCIVKNVDKLSLVRSINYLYANNPELNTLLDEYKNSIFDMLGISKKEKKSIKMR